MSGPLVAECSTAPLIPSFLCRWWVVFYFQRLWTWSWWNKSPVVDQCSVTRNIYGVKQSCWMWLKGDAFFKTSSCTYLDLKHKQVLRQRIQLLLLMKPAWELESDAGAGSSCWTLSDRPGPSGAASSFTTRCQWNPKDPKHPLPAAGWPRSSRSSLGGNSRQQSPN